MHPDTAHIGLSIVIPAYNERENVRLLYESIIKTIDTLGFNTEIIFVDDGSSDGTFEALMELRAADERVRIVRLRRNFGQTPAMSAGIDCARGEVIITLDADLQNDPADIPRLMEKMSQGYEIVSGWRRDRKDKAVSRKLPSMIANRMIGIITGVRIHDYGCTLKAYRASLLKELPLYSDMHRFIPALGALAGARVAELEVRHHPRRFGRSKYGISRTFKVLCDVLTVKLIIRFSSQPMRMFAGMMLASWVVSGVFAVQSYFVHVSRTPEELTPIIHPTVALLFFFLGLFLFSMGMLGEYILKLSDHRISKLEIDHKGADA